MSINLDRLSSEYARASENSDFAKVEYFTINKGDNFYHILPRWNDENDGLPYHEVGLHFLVDYDGKRHAYLCAHYSGEGRCPICEKSKRLQSSADIQEKELGKSIRCVKRFMYNAADKTGSIKVLNAGPQLHQEILFELREDISAGFDPVAYENGALIKVTRTGTNWTDTKYKARAERSRHTISTPTIQLPQLDKIHEIYSSEELDLVLDGNFDPKGRKNKSTPKTESNESTNEYSEETKQPIEVKQKTNKVTAPVKTPQLQATTKSSPSLDKAKEILGL